MFFSCSHKKRTKRMRDRSGRSDLYKRSAFTRCSRHVFAQASLCKPRRQSKAESGFIPVCSFLCVFSLSQCNASHCRANTQRGCCLRLIGFAPAGAGEFCGLCLRAGAICGWELHACGYGRVPRFLSAGGCRLRLGAPTPAGAGKALTAVLARQTESHTPNRPFLRQSVPHGTKFPAARTSRCGVLRRISCPQDRKTCGSRTLCGSFLHKWSSDSLAASFSFFFFAERKRTKTFPFWKRGNGVLFSVKRKEPKDLPRLPPRTPILRLIAVSTRLPA